MSKARDVPKVRNLPLTKRHRRILQLIADGYEGPEIARKLRIALDTERTHSAEMRSRLGARTRAEAVAIGLRRKLIK